MKTASARRLPAWLFAALCCGAPVFAQQPVANTVPPPPTAPAPPAPASRWTPAQIQQAFEQADADSNGSLSRAEAQRLPLLPRSFEEADLNKDGVLTRAEYEASFSR